MVLNGFKGKELEDEVMKGLKTRLDALAPGGSIRFQGTKMGKGAAEPEIREAAKTAISRGFSMTKPTAGQVDIKKIAEEAEFGAFWGMLSTATNEQILELGKVMADEAGMDGKIAASFDFAPIRKVLRKMTAFKDVGEKPLTALLSAMDKNEAIVDFLTGDKFIGTGLQGKEGGPRLVEIIEAFREFKDSGKGLASQIDVSANEAKEALENFTRVKSGITRLTETLLSMAKSLDGIKKVRKAFSGERVDLLGKAGQGLSIGGFAQAQSRAQFGDDRAKLTATTAAANATKIMTALRSRESGNWR